MLLSKEIEIKLTGSTIKYYEDLGYYIPKHIDKQNRVSVKKGTKIKVKVDDLSHGTHTKVKVKCDYCGEEFEKAYYKYIEQKNKTNIQKDACIKCSSIKSKEVLFDKYGVTQNTQIPKVRKKLSENQREDENKVREDFKKLGYEIVEEFFNYINDTKKIKFICSKHPEEGVQETNYRVIKYHSGGCRKCRYDKISGENCHLWKGGTTPIETYLRDRIGDWKKETMEHDNYICQLSGLKFDVIHHIYPFINIVNETLKETNIENKSSISEYNDIELDKLTKQCLDLHKRYGLGICLNLQLHLLYHAKYHKNELINYTTFEEFNKKYYNGEFDDELNEELKSYNSIKRLKENGIKINLKEVI